MLRIWGVMAPLFLRDARILRNEGAAGPGREPTGSACPRLAVGERAEPEGGGHLHDPEDKEPDAEDNGEAEQGQARVGESMAAGLRLDELVVRLDPAVLAEDEDLQADGRDLAAVGRDHFPVELDDVGQALRVIPWPEGEFAWLDEFLV